MKKVSFVCTTYGRFTCVERIVAQYHAQTYPNKELIIFNTDEEHPYELGFEDPTIVIVNNNINYQNTNLKLKLSKGVKQGVVIDASQLADIQQKNKNCSYDNLNEVRLFAIKSFANIGSNINCNDPKLDKPEYYKYIIDDIAPFINQSYKNQHSNFEIKDSSGGKIMSYIALENEQLGKLTRNTYLKSGSDLTKLKSSSSFPIYSNSTSYFLNERILSVNELEFPVKSPDIVICAF